MSISRNGSDTPAAHASDGKIEDWLYTYEINISSSSSSLYANGHQQVELEIRLSSRSEQVITDEQYESIQLYTKSVNGTYNLLATDLGPVTRWAQQKSQDERFDYYPGDLRKISIKHENKEHRETDRSKKLYITTNSTGGSTLTIGAGITFAPGTVYYSDETPFHSSITLTAQTPPSYDLPEDYTFVSTREDIIPGRFINLYRLTLRHLPLVTAECTPQGMIKWERNAVGESRATHVGWVGIGQVNVRYESEIVQSFSDAFKERLYQSLPSPDSNRVVIVMQGDNGIFFDNNIATKFKGPMTVKGLDKYGNLHNLEISFSQNSREELSIQPLSKSV